MKRVLFAILAASIPIAGCVRLTPREYEERIPDRFEVEPWAMSRATRTEPIVPYEPIEIIYQNDLQAEAAETRAGHEIAKVYGHEGGVWAIAFDPTGRILATGSTDKTVKLWDLSSRTVRVTFSRQESWIESLAFSPDGDVLASVCREAEVALWDPKVESRVATLSGHGGHVCALAFSPDGKILATGGLDETIKPITLHSSRWLPQLRGEVFGW